MLVAKQLEKGARCSASIIAVISSGRARSLGRANLPSGDPERSTVALDDALQREKLENSIKHISEIVMLLGEIQDYAKRHILERVTVKTHHVLRNIGFGGMQPLIEDYELVISELRKEQVALGFTQPALPPGKAA